MKTIIVKPQTMTKKWYLIDAEGKELGRVAVAAANILRGKNKPEYLPNEDMGDYVIIIYAAKAALTGNKANDKMYYRVSGYAGGLKECTVIHGRGAGILQNGLRQLFKKSPIVASFRKGKYNEGGDGVTVVKFKE